MRLYDGWVTTAFQRLLFESFLAWQKDSGKSLPQGAYAKYLQVTPGALSNYMNGKRTPRAKKEIEKLAERLGMHVYDALDLPRPDPLLQLVIDNWGLLPDAAKKEIVETVQRAEARQLSAFVIETLANLDSLCYATLRVSWRSSNRNDLAPRAQHKAAYATNRLG